MSLFLLWNLSLCEKGKGEIIHWSILMDREVLPVTSVTAMRLLFFKGCSEEEDSALVTRVCKDYETISAVHRGECATRTFLNLYNLRAVRGPVKGQLVANASMSGPHHYFGWIDPRKSYTLKPDPSSGPGLLYFEAQPSNSPPSLHSLRTDQVMTLASHEWLKGSELDPAGRAAFGHVGLSEEYIDVDTAKDSLFKDPGFLVLEQHELCLPLLEEPHLYDLSSFRARVVPNEQPWCFNQDLVSQYRHAQHRLRVVTYNYGQRYVEDYLMPGSGIFIERHDFVQAITPMNEQCGGFVILGREEEGRLQLMGVTLPFGFTLIVEAQSIHGDSTLTGMYQMAMTGNHVAMATADSVFIKETKTHRNVVISTSSPSSQQQETAELMLTSDRKSLAQLHLETQSEIERIRDKLPFWKHLWWKPIIFTPRKWNPREGWHPRETKTLGIHLPEQKENATEPNVARTQFGNS